MRLILLAAVLTSGALAGTVLRWRRWGPLLRPVGVLGTELLLTLTVGLVANRSQEFYPTWGALFAGSDPRPGSFHTTAGRLDGWLAAQPATGEARSFPWQPDGWTGWHLAAAPTVTVPAGYLAHPDLRYSAVLLVGARAGRPPAVGGPTVLVTVTTTAATTAATLGQVLPGELGRDLRVTSHRWALVTSAADNTLARQVVALARGRFPALAFVGTAAPRKAPSKKASRAKAAAPARAAAVKAAGTRTHPQHWVGSMGAATYDNSCLPVHSTAGTTTASCPLPSGIQTAYFPATGLTGALDWAAAQTPLPLAASAPEPTYLPPPPRRPHHARPTTPSPTQPAEVVKHGSGQPRP